MITDVILLRMNEYLDRAKKVLEEDEFLQPTIFAYISSTDTLVLPLMQEDDVYPENTLDIVSKILIAHDVSDYFVITESYIIQDNEAFDCINVIYSGTRGKRLISVPFKKITGSKEIFFGESTELDISNLEGTVFELFYLKSRTPTLSEKECMEIRILFPLELTEESLILH